MVHSHEIHFLNLKFSKFAGWISILKGSSSDDKNIIYIVKMGLDCSYLQYCSAQFRMRVPHNLFKNTHACVWSVILWNQKQEVMKISGKVSQNKWSPPKNKSTWSITLYITYCPRNSRNKLSPIQQGKQICCLQPKCLQLHSRYQWAE